MKAQLNFWTNDENNTRWLRMKLLGGDWPSGWAIEYHYLESWGMLTWFATPPAESEGLLPGQDYQMSDTPQEHEFASFLNNLGQLINQIKPTPDPVAGVSYQHTVE